MFGFLRVVRGLFGLLAAWQVLGLLPVLTWLQNLSGVGGQMVVQLVFKLIAFGLFFAGFYFMRPFINKLHVKKTGVPHPALAKTWSL